MVERRHRVERVRQRAKPEPDREHAFAVARRRVTRGAHDALIEEEARDVVDALRFRRHRHHDERAAARFDHLARAFDRRGHDPLAAMHAAELRVEERSFEVDAEAPRADRIARFDELVRGFRDFGRGVHHRLPRRRHDPGDVARRALPRVRARCGDDGVALVAIEQHLVGAVRVYVDHAPVRRSLRREAGCRTARSRAGCVRSVLVRSQPVHEPTCRRRARAATVRGCRCPARPGRFGPSAPATPLRS